MTKLADVIDFSAIEDLRLLQRPGRPDLVNELIQMFIIAFEAGLITIKKAVSDSDLKVLSATSHSLKSSASCLGATTLANLLLKLEKLSNGDLEDESFDKLASLIAVEYEKAKNALETLIAKV